MEHTTIYKLGCYKLCEVMKFRHWVSSKPRTVDQIIRILRQADGGRTVAEICREHNIAEGTFYRWKK